MVGAFPRPSEVSPPPPFPRPPHQTIRCSDSCPNQIDDACRILDETINQMVQNSLNQFETDCNTAIESVETILKQDTEAGKHNTTVRLRGMILLWLGLLIPVLSGFALFVFLLGSKLPSLVGPEWAGSFQSVADVCRSA